MTSHACTIKAVRLDMLVNDLAYMSALIRLEYNISRLYHLTED